jgi:RNA polymerase sigma-54 factor
MAMQLSQTMRPELRQLLTPRMIQSMEILQLPLAELEQRIEQELQNNPVLELDSETAEDGGIVKVDDAEPTRSEDRSEDESPLLVKEDSDQSADFDRLEKLSEYLENEEFFTNSSMREHRVSQSYDGERDKKLDAMTNTAARGEDLSEHLLKQWHFVETTAGVYAAGEAIINYIDSDGYLRTDLEVIQKESKKPLTIEDLHTALKEIQTLDPTGVGARNLKECLLIQLDALEDDPEHAEDHDFELERKLVQDHLNDLEMNRYPQISRKLGREIPDIKRAVRGLARLNPHPGKDIGGVDAPQINPDAVIYFDEETGKYEVRMTRDSTPSLFISAMYRRMLKERACDKKTREFLSNNVRNARWLIESIEQRNSTILRVIKAVVEHQKEFFDKGPEHLKPLPMINVADQLGIHVATVSRAVSEKWVETPRGIMPLRRFFSGGTTSADGEDMSWDAVKEKLRVIIDNEDKNNPLNDDEIVEKLTEQGIHIARRTVAKYRKILNIPPARQRKEF